MKTKLLALFSFLLLVNIGIFSQIVNIPDANFKSYLVGNSSINTNSDSEIQVSEANAFTGTINCQNMNISDLTGIEAFTSLTSLLCGNNPLGSIDVTQNIALATFQPYDCNLSSLDVTQNTSLGNLVCFGNNLTSLNVSQNPNLNLFVCRKNNLTTLDVSLNTNLSIFICDSNNLTSLDVSNSSGLSNFNCSYNNLTSLNMSNVSSTSCSLDARYNPNLTCIEVDDVVSARVNWTNIDTSSSFNLNCNSSSLIEQSDLSLVNIYPNPTSSHLTISFNGDIDEVKLIDLTGKTVISKKTLISSFDISDLVNGVYFIQVISEGKSITKKVIKE